MIGDTDVRVKKDWVGKLPGSIHILSCVPLRFCRLNTKLHSLRPVAASQCHHLLRLRKGSRKADEAVGPYDTYVGDAACFRVFFVFLILVRPIFKASSWQPELGVYYSTFLFHTQSATAIDSVFYSTQNHVSHLLDIIVALDLLL